MRLICPNCGAQYEVADDVIPQDGRDVQCSNCAHTWLETPGASALAEDLALGDATAAQTRAHEETELQDDDPRIVDDIGEDLDDQPSDAPATLPDESQRRSALAGSVADILREEAEREQAARRAEAPQTVDVQEELGVESLPAAAGQRPTAQEARLARQQDIPPATMPPATVPDSEPPASRSQMFPDIEEINSTLRSSSDRAVEPDSADQQLDAQKGRFGSGFLLSLLIVGALVALYIFAPAISNVVPALADPLANFTAQVDTMRIWLDVKLQELLAAGTS